MKTQHLKKRLLALLCTGALTLALLPGGALAAGAAPAETSNIGGTYNGNWAVPIQSYLYQDGQDLVRVEYDPGQYIYMSNSGQLVERRPPQVVVETYNASFQLQSTLTLEPELPVWGGFYGGADYNFLLFGQENPGESDSVEVIRVVKYDKGWNRLGQASLYGANTYIPFEAGSLRCDEYNGYLYVRTAHEMYTSSDGLNHQANLTFSVREQDMAITDSFSGVANTSAGYVSHSFNQHILVDEAGNIVTLDHGDAYPRSAVLMRYAAKAGGDKFITGSGSYWGAVADAVEIQAFTGSIGDNVTGAQVTGLAETSSGYLSAYSYTGKGSNSSIGTDVSNVYLAYTSKNQFSSGGTTVRQLTSFSSDSAVYGSQPRLVPTGLDGGYILWSMAEKADNGYFYSNDATQYARYDATGAISAVSTAENAPLSNCSPIVFNGQVVWYTTHESAPTFYTLSDAGVTAHPVQEDASQPEPQPEPDPAPGGTSEFLDVPASHWAYPYISRAAQNGWVTGMGNGSFQPDSTLTFAQFYTMVTPIFRAQELAAYQPDPGAPWWQKYMWVGATHLMANTIWVDTQPAAGKGMAMQDSIDQHADQEISRTDAISILWRALGEWKANETIPGVDAAREKLLSDGVDLNMMEWDTVPVCYAAGLVAGDENGDLNLQGTLTRAEGCVMLCNLVDYAASHGISMAS